VFLPWLLQGADRPARENQATHGDGGQAATQDDQEMGEECAAIEVCGGLADYRVEAGGLRSVGIDV
jgi:hypothetical protein